ncbi:MAG TPA: sulfite oxidase [Actinomycetota bacterium]|nr:sulfite oxidase [Actinomycetota bacterium]
MERRREDGIGLDELAQATRNHGMPLEALRADITPAGLHYVLIHYDVPFLDESTHALSLEGFDRPLSLTLDELRSRPSVTMPATFECAGNGRALFDARPFSQPWLLEAVGTAEWTGTPLAGVLHDAGVPGGTGELLFTGVDRGVEGGEEQSYERALSLDEAMRDEVLLVYAMNGRALPPQHGGPLRLLVPGWYGMTNVKWLARITVLSAPYEGYQNAVAYRLRTDPDERGEPVSRMRVRSLMAPPGIPTFPERERVVPSGPTTLEGRAWSGTAPIERVEVSVDGCERWTDAALEPAPSPYAWHRWTFDWTATPGIHEVACRATDADGVTQPLEAEPNIGGYANNAVHRVRVTVTDRPRRISAS